MYDVSALHSSSRHQDTDQRAIDIYTAATVLLSERLRSIRGTPQITESWTQHWNSAIKLLGAYAQVGDSARRCMAALSLLSAKIRDVVDHTQGDGSNVELQDQDRDVHSAATLSVGCGWMDSIKDATFLPDLEDIDFNVDDSSWLIDAPFDRMF